MKLENILNAAIGKESFCVPKEMVINGSFLAETSGQVTLTGYVNNVFDDRTPGSATRGIEFNAARYPGNPFNFLRALELSMPRGREFGLTGEYNF